MIATVAAVAVTWTAAAIPTGCLIGRRLRHARHLEDHMPDQPIVPRPAALDALLDHVADQLDATTVRADDADAQLDDAFARRKRVEAELDGAYRERAHLLAWLATHYPAVMVPALDLDEAGWWLLYITAPTGQLSWHISPRDAGLLAHVQRVEPDDPRAQWDGHTTEQKYERVMALVADLAQCCGPECAEAHTYTGRCELAPVDVCRVVDVGGEPIRVQGSGEMSEQSRAALAEVIGAARAKYVAEHPDGEPVISPRVAAHVLWQEGLGGHPAGSFTTALLKAWWAADPANSSRLSRAWPEYGAAITLLTQPGGVDQLRTLAGEQPAPDRP